MAALHHALLALFLAAAPASAQVEHEMGPAAFMWPPDRVWSAAADNTAPCGSVASAGARTRFPLRNGRVALVAQDESWDAVLGISYQAEPRSNADFTTLISASAFRNIDPGHTCVSIADPPPTVRAGENATLQIRYSSEFDNPKTETFYACADIVYVDAANFSGPVPCFNATDPDPDDGPDRNFSPSDGLPAPDDGGAGLSGGAVAGIVVGCVAGVALLLAAALLLYRRRRQRRRRQRQQNSVRAVKWDEQAAGRSGSAGGVKLQNLSS